MSDASDFPSAELPWSTTQRVALWGWGREGHTAYQWIRQREPVRDLHVFALPSELETIRDLKDAALTVSEVGGDVALGDFDWVVKSPGISPHQDAVRSAQSNGTRFVGGTYIWARAHADNAGALRNTICVTGTKGKSTTTSLTAHLLRAGGHRVLLAGNIGLPLLQTPDTDAGTIRVIELSSYQTADLAASGARPEVAVVVNIFPEHLDWHGGEAQYVQDKLMLVTDAHPKIAVLNRADPRLVELQLPQSEIHYFGGREGWHLRDDELWHGERLIMDTRDLPLPGRHNRGNLCAALTAIDALGIAAEPLAAHAATFMPLPNRLQTIGVRDGIRYINDSIATTPHATLAALACFEDSRVALIVGGHDRGLDWGDFASALAARSHVPELIATMGPKGKQIFDLLQSVCAQRGIQLVDSRSLASAFAACEHHLRHSESNPVAARGPAVLLMSPGAPSFDAYRDYVERGKHFAVLAGFDPERIANIQGLGLD